MKINIKWLRFGLLHLIISCVLITGCAEDSTISAQATYEEAYPRSSSTLIVPPGLSSPELDSNYNMLYIKHDYGRYNLDTNTSMTIMRGGSERWLVVKNSNVNQVFPMVLHYLDDLGVKPKYVNQSLGLIQTDWFNKNKSEKPGKFASLLGFVGLKKANVLPELYTFKINLWQNGSNVNMFVTDYQVNMVSQSGGGNSQNQNESAAMRGVWVSVPSDPQLELNFLLQFMLFVKSGNASTITNLANVPAGFESEAISNNVSRASLVTNAVIVNDDFDRTWWRTGLALERVGLGVADKNRSSGEFYVYPLQNNVENVDPSTLSRWFGDDKSEIKVPKAKYTVQLLTISPNQTKIIIKPYIGVASNNFASVGEKYLKQIYDELK